MAELWRQAETVDPEVRAYINSLVAAVGGGSTYDDTYAVGDDATAALNDILRWLRLYDEKLSRYDVKRCLAEANLVKGDLLEILALWSEEVAENKLKAKLALTCLQLMVPLTWPMELEDDKTTVNHHRHLPHLQLAQVGYKRAILHYEHAKILRTVVRIALPAMGVERRERSKRDEGIIRMAMYLFRNMAMITQPQMLPSQGDENEISRPATIEAFAEQDVFNMLLAIGSGASDEFQDQDVVLLEILFSLLKGIDPKKLFLQEKQLQVEEADELRTLMQKEKAMHNGYNKHAPSRHNRFGTMIWVKRDDMKMSTVSGQQSIADENTTLQQMDSSKKWNKPKYRGKLTNEFNEQSDFGMRVDLTEPARQKLKSFVEDFLDSSFNPLFSSLRRAIEREAERVFERNIRQYFYLISWFLSAECARRDQAHRQSSWHVDRPTHTNAEDNTFAYIAAVLDQETFVLLNRNMQKAFDDKSWQDLQATLLCFTQILLTVQSMTDSKDEEDQEIAENIQNRIFYEEATHDRLVQILRGYTNQGFAYLDAVTECVHVFVRMLERYSKQNADLQVRSKRRARKKAKAKDDQPPTNPDDDAEQDNEDEREAYAMVSERKFDFARFSAKFLSQGCVDTFVALTHFYSDLTPSQLKRCHRYFYRLAFKHELAILLFRVDILLLLNRMIKGPNGLSPEFEGFRDWEQLVQQVFRRCIKWMSKDNEGQGWKEMCVVEMLFSKVPATMFYLQNGYERVVETRAPRAPAEMEFKSGVGEEQRIPVAVTLLIEQAKGNAVEWVKKELTRAIGERSSWQDEKEAWDQSRGDEAEPTDHAEKAPTIFLVPDTDERKAALFKDKHLRLLLTTLGCERLGLSEDVDASWIVPSELSAEQLQEALKVIQQTEFDPPSFDEGQTAADMIRNKTSASRARAAAVPFDDDSEGAVSDIDNEALFPPNLREKRKADDSAEPAKKRRRLTKRNATELTDAQAHERAEERKRREKERNKKIKSALYVTAEDDESDVERDQEFFREEEKRRKKTQGIIRRELLKVAEQESGDASKGGGKSKAKRKEKILDEDEESGSESVRGVSSDHEDVEMDDENAALRRRDATTDDSDSPSPSSDDDGDEEGIMADLLGDHGEEDEDTPSTSPHPMPTDDGKDIGPLAEVSANVGMAARGQIMAKTVVSDDDDEEEEEAPVLKRPPARRNLRAGFLLDDSDEDD